MVQGASGDSTRTAGVAATGWVLPLAALGLALFLSSMWTARADAAGVSTAVVYATRFVSFGTYMVMAYTFRNHLPQVNLVLGLAVASTCVHLAVALATPVLNLDANVSLVLDYLQGVFEGIGNALITLLFAHIFSSFRPHRSALGLGAAFLGVDACILFLDTLGTDAIHYMRPVFTLCAVAIVLLCARRLLAVGSSSASGERGLQYGMTRTGGEEERPLAFFSTHMDWFLLLIVAFLFPSLFGVIAQVSSETGGNFALYDIPTEIVMVALQALFLLFMAHFGTRFGFATILAFVIPLYATGFALFPGDWAAGNPFAGCLIRAGYVVLTVLLWVLMARKSHDDPRHTYLYFGIYCGISNAQAGRLLGSFLMGDAGPSLQLRQGISLAALWAVCIFGLVMFFLLQRNASLAAFGAFATLDAARDAAGAQTSAPAPNAAPTRPIAPPGVDAFATQFDNFASRMHFTQREREVVAEALHGYSRTSIAKKLNLSPETVKTYLNRAYAKAHVTSKQELIAQIEGEAL